MYFGGINGITTFRPELLLDNPYTPPVVITKLQLFNKVVRPDDETGILTKNISETKSITLKSWQTAFPLSSWYPIISQDNIILSPISWKVMIRNGII